VVNEVNGASEGSLEFKVFPGKVNYYSRFLEILLEVYSSSAPGDQGPPGQPGAPGEVRYADFATGQGTSIAGPVGPPGAPGAPGRDGKQVNKNQVFYFRDFTLLLIPG
jgi:hypothetical protein